MKKEYDSKTIFSYVWIVGINLVKLLIVNVILNSTYNPSEIITYCLLIIIYLSIDSFFISHNHSLIKMSLGLDEEFERVREILKEKENEEEKEYLGEVKAKLNKVFIKMYINDGFNILIYIIVLFNLFSVL